MTTYYNPKEATQYTIHTTQQSPFSLATNIKCLEWTYSKFPKASRVGFGRRRISASRPTMVSPVSGDPCRGWRLGIPWIQACCADRWGWLVALALQVLTTHSFIVFGGWHHDLQGAEHGAQNKGLLALAPMVFWRR